MTVSLTILSKTEGGSSEEVATAGEADANAEARTRRAALPAAGAADRAIRERDDDNMAEGEAGMEGGGAGCQRK